MGNFDDGRMVKQFVLAFFLMVAINQIFPFSNKKNTFYKKMCWRKSNVFFFRWSKNQFFVSCLKISSRLCSCLCKVWMVRFKSAARLKIAGRMSTPD